MITETGLPQKGEAEHRRGDIKIYSESLYFVGEITLAFSAALATKADFGVNALIAPAYLLYRKISETLPFFTYGMGDITVEILLLILLCLILRHFEKKYLLSFITVLFYAVVLDGAMVLMDFLPGTGFLWRCFLFAVSRVLGGLGCTAMFYTYLPPEVYELFVKEISRQWGFKTSTVKTAYDVTSFFTGIIMSFLFYGFMHFEGIRFGTLISAVVTGPLIAFWTAVLEKYCIVEDRWPLRGYFERAINK